MIIYSVFGSEKGYGAVRVRSPDTDIFSILLNHASIINCEIYFETGVGNKRRLLNIETISNQLGETFCKALLGLHAFTGCDTTSAFKGIGKLKPLKLLQKEPQFEKFFSELGDS